MSLKKVWFESTVGACAHPKYGVLNPGINEFDEEIADALIELGLVTAYVEQPELDSGVQLSEQFSIKTKREKREVK